MKKIFKFILILLPWFLSSILFKVDKNYYYSLNLPFFAPKPIFFGIIWTILYILISISIFKIYNVYNKKDLKDYNISLLINYISNQLFTFFFFTIKNNFLSFIDIVIVLLSSLFVYYESKSLDNKASKFLIPYIYFLIFATILTLSIYFMNL